MGMRNPIDETHFRKGSMMARTARIQRETAETRIELRLDLDGTGQATLATGIGFFDHMLTPCPRTA